MLHVWIIFLHYVKDVHIQGEMYVHIPYIIWSVWVRENSTWIIGQLVNHALAFQLPIYQVTNPPVTSILGN